MRDDTVANVDREIVGWIARASLRREEKVPGPIVRRAGLRDGDKRDQETRGYCISEKLFHLLLQSCVVDLVTKRRKEIYPFSLRLIRFGR